ncbi:gamma-glutamyl kinase [Streptomyces scabiei]|uniref:glutamate 5-kinase n=1 Tax=Streptomyces scabiei TaxID=1930 RepID=UPI0004E77211|nr:gamma-glutamyl kinase [Streptomyces scabiei]
MVNLPSVSSVTGGLDEGWIDTFVDLLVEARGEGEQLDREIVLVLSGTIAAGLTPLGLRTRPRDRARQQAAASVGQGLLLVRYGVSFARHGVNVGPVSLALDDATDRRRYRNASRTLAKLLAMGALPIVTENETVTTHDFESGSDGLLAVFVAHLAQADLLVLLSDVEGLSDGEPSSPDPSRSTGPAGPGGLRSRPAESSSAMRESRARVEAAHIAARAGTPVILTSVARAADALAGRPTGTFYPQTGERYADRMPWLAHSSAPNGALVLDDDAVQGVVQDRKPLLLTGILQIEGQFEAGDTVELRDQSGRAVARGQVNFTATMMRHLLSRSTVEPERESVAARERRVAVDRDDLVLLPTI